MARDRRKKRAKTKINRNAPCTCGSGKKYKKCCGSAIAKSSPLWQLRQLEKEFEKYNKLELVSLLSSLQICPENHSQLLRLESASRVACKSENIDNISIEPINLSNILKTYIPSQGFIGIQEDPIEGLFTDNIIYFGGNYTVYGGLSHVDSFIVQNLLKTIFYNSKKLPKVFVNSVFAAATCLLNLSNEIAKRNNQYRYMESPDRWREDIIVPDMDTMQKLSNLTVFSKKEVEELISIDYDFIKPFVIPIGHEALNNEDIIKNPLIMAPFVEVNNNIVAALPGSLMGALIHFIWVKSQQFGVTDILLKKLIDRLWIGININLDMMNFKPNGLDIPSWEWDIGKEAIFEIDSDKLAYVLFITDDLSDFKIDEPYGIWDPIRYNDLVDERCEFISKWLTEGENPHCNELLVMVIIGQVGRFGSFGLKELPEKVHSILMLADELDVVAKTRECDNLSLWKFSKALDTLDHPIMASF